MRQCVWNDGPRMILCVLCSLAVAGRAVTGRFDNDVHQTLYVLFESFDQPVSERPDDLGIGIASGDVKRFSAGQF